MNNAVLVGKAYIYVCVCVCCWLRLIAHGDQTYGATQAPVNMSKRDKCARDMRRSARAPMHAGMGGVGRWC